MSTAEKRSVHTDALKTLGSIIGDNEQRDAIHLAVEPAVAGQPLTAGQHVGRMQDGSWGFPYDGKTLGIVDPFIKGKISPGQRFWLIIYPRQITSLRHVWEHPDFSPQAMLANDAVSVSKRWIEDFADRLDQTYNRVMEAAEGWLISEDYTYDNSETYKDHYGEFPEFWIHYQAVTGTVVPSDKKECFFTCSC